MRAAPAQGVTASQRDRAYGRRFSKHHTVGNASRDSSDGSQRGEPPTAFPVLGASGLRPEGKAREPAGFSDPGSQSAQVTVQEEGCAQGKAALIRTGTLPCRARTPPRPGKEPPSSHAAAVPRALPEPPEAWRWAGQVPADSKASAASSWRSLALTQLQGTRGPSVAATQHGALRVHTATFLGTETAQTPQRGQPRGTPVKQPAKAQERIHAQELKHRHRRTPGHGRLQTDRQAF